MTATPRLQASQAAPGAGLELSTSIQAGSLADYGAWSGQSLGTTVTGTPPAAFTDLAHNQNIGFASTFMDTETFVETDSRAEGTQYGVNVQLRDHKYMRLDGNFAAGKYLWLIVWATLTPSGADAPIAVDGPYLIR